MCGASVPWSEFERKHNFVMLATSAPHSFVILQAAGELALVW